MCVPTAKVCLNGKLNTTNTRCSVHQRNAPDVNRGQWNKHTHSCVSHVLKLLKYCFKLFMQCKDKLYKLLNFKTRNVLSVVRKMKLLPDLDQLLLKKLKWMLNSSMSWSLSLKERGELFWDTWSAWKRVKLQVCFARKFQTVRAGYLTYIYFTVNIAEAEESSNIKDGKPQQKNWLEEAEKRLVNITYYYHQQ